MGVLLAGMQALLQAEQEEMQTLQGVEDDGTCKTLGEMNPTNSSNSAIFLASFIFHLICGRKLKFKMYSVKHNY